MKVVWSVCIPEIYFQESNFKGRESAIRLYRNSISVFSDASKLPVDYLCLHSSH